MPDVSLEVEPLPLLLALEAVVVDVLAEAGVLAADPVVVDPVLVEPLVEPVAADDVDVAPFEPVNALTSAWKSCCSFASVAASGSDNESDEVADGEELEDDEALEDDEGFEEDEELEEDEPLEDDPDEAFGEEPARSCSRF